MPSAFHLCRRTHDSDVRLHNVRQPCGWRGRRGAHADRYPMLTDACPSTLLANIALPMLTDTARLACRDPPCSSDSMQGLCVYLLDPSVPGWDTKFDGTGPLGFVGKTGAILGVGIDCAGNFASKPNHVAVKNAQGGVIMGEAVELKDGVVTEENEWIPITIQIDIKANLCDVTVGEQEVIHQLKLTGVTIPETVCVAVCAGTTKGRSNMICVNNLDIVDAGM